MGTNKGKKNRVDRFIISKEVRLVDQNGEMKGIVSIEQALALAQNVGLNLVEVAPDSRPPVCKILDFSRYKYEIKKKAKETKRKQKVIVTKEIKLRPNISEHDCEIKVSQIKSFLDKKYRVKVILRFIGRELAHIDIGLEKLNNLINDVQDVAKVDSELKREGNQFFLMLSAKEIKG
ncbi:translation initiation factor IF-3 [Wolbachia endosymbiont of Pentidionis agamae]|uniref:translation initiation factor IF-3 n=1 Tax=Wolbachia endosymbiont of Pentidionis agamae TaxID=3110435 RepID=UPI002FCFA6AD